ncbi:MAG: YciI family protein [Pyrinomonadaceae bacterium]
MMRFMTLVRAAENSGPPPPELMEAIAKLSEEASKGGTMLEAGGLAPTAMSNRVRLSKGKVTVIDGPFAETKEVIGGYAVFEVKSKQEMIDATVQFMELHREHWPGWEGETEIRQMFGPSDCTP